MLECSVVEGHAESVFVNIKHKSTLILYNPDI